MSQEGSGLAVFLHILKLYEVNTANKIKAQIVMGGGGQGYFETQQSGKVSPRR